MLLVGGFDIKAELKKQEEECSNLLVGTPVKLFDVMERLDTLNYKNLEVVLEAIENSCVVLLCLKCKSDINCCCVCVFEADFDPG